VAVDRWRREAHSPGQPRLPQYRSAAAVPGDRPAAVADRNAAHEGWDGGEGADFDVAPYAVAAG